MANKINDGGPAFPVPIAATSNANHEPMIYDSMDRCLAGMSLRTWLAGRAMQALISKIPTEYVDKTDARKVARDVAKAAVRYTDALLDELVPATRDDINPEAVPELVKACEVALATIAPHVENDDAMGWGVAAELLLVAALAKAKGGAS